MDASAQFRVEQGIYSALLSNTKNILIEDEEARAACILSSRIICRANKLRNSLERMEDTKQRIRNSPQILADLLQHLRTLTHIRDWQQHKQRWHKKLLGWRQEILADNPDITSEKFQNARQRHREAYSLHHHYIHLNQLPLITTPELAIMAAYSPLLERWRSTLPTQRPTLPPNFTNPATLPAISSSQQDVDIEDEDGSIGEQRGPTVETDVESHDSIKS